VRGHGSKFSRKMEEAVAALLTQRNVEEAARSIGISVATLMRWQKQPEFEKAYREARRAAFGQSIAKLHQMSSAAVSTLGKVMVDPGTPPSTKVRAAEAIITHGAKAIEVEDIEARVSELERAAEATKQHR
jgi:transposase-like protein